MLSFSFDIMGVLAQAGPLASQLFPVFALPIGITIGFALVTWVVNALKKAFGSLGGGR